MMMLSSVHWIAVVVIIITSTVQVVIETATQLILKCEKRRQHFPPEAIMSGNTANIH